MTPGPATAGLIFVGFGVLVAGAWAWLIAATKAAVTWRWIPQLLSKQIELLLQSFGYRSRLPLIPWNSRQPVSWALVDLLVVVCGLVILGAITRVLGLIPEGKLDQLSLHQKQLRIASDAGLSLLITIASVLLVVVRGRARHHPIGVSWLAVQKNLRQGLIAFAMLAPPVFALQGLLVMLWKPSKHPIVELFKSSPEVGLFILLAFTAVIVAPLFEELMFRVLLQGYLEKVFSFRHDVVDLLLGIESPDLPNAPMDAVAAATLNPKSKIQNPKCDEPELRGWSAWLPIGISSAIFALLHFEHGPDWIPLLLLAAGMGYLYQRTHSILPGLIVHSLLNATSMWALWVSVKEGIGNAG